jgi:hypothetical protein
MSWNPFAFLNDPVNGKSPQAKAHAKPRNSVEKQKRLMKKMGVDPKYVRKP